MKILVIGHARHGKDTVSEMLAKRMGLKFRSSSDFANERAVFPVLAPKYGYKTLNECYQDRVNHRQEWYELIRDYNGDDPARLVRELYQECDIYCGLRHREEFEAAKAEGLFGVVVWVDAIEREPAEPADSMSLTAADADVIFNNNNKQNVHDRRYQFLIELKMMTHDKHK